MATNENDASFESRTREVFDAFQRKDGTKLRSLIRPEFGTTGGVPGNRMSGAEWAGLTETGFELRSFTVSEPSARVEGDTAVVSYSYTQDASYQGHSSAPDWFITDVWVRRDGEWQLLGRHYEILKQN